MGIQPKHKQTTVKSLREQTNVIPQLFPDSYSIEYTVHIHQSPLVLSIIHHTSKMQLVSRIKTEKAAGYPSQRIGSRSRSPLSHCRPTDYAHFAEDKQPLGEISGVLNDPRRAVLRAPAPHQPPADRALSPGSISVEEVLCALKGEKSHCRAHQAYCTKKLGYAPGLRRMWTDTGEG